jgi:hypothetical protein
MGNSGISVSTIRGWQDKRAESAIKKMYTECKKKMIFGVVFEPPKHLSLSHNSGLLVKKMSKSDSDLAIEASAKAVGESCLMALRSKYCC